VATTTALWHDQAMSVHGQWTTVSELGRGGEGQTFLVEPVGGGPRHVLKRLMLASVERWSAVDRFEREMAVLASLDHPQIPRVVDSFEDPSDGTSCLVQTYVEGPTFRALLGQEHSGKRIEAWLVSALDVLAYLHGRVPPVLHRDLSPGNLIVSGERVHVVDFGAVKGATGDGGTVTAVGTFGFMPLEQARGQATAASDLYALGMSFVCLAAGVEPADLPLDARRGRVDVAAAVARCDLSPQMVAALEAMTAPGLAERASSVEAVRAILAGRAPPSPTPGSPRLKLGLALFLLVMVAGLLWLAATPSLAPREVARLGGWFEGHPRIFGGDPYLYGAQFSPDGRQILSFDSQRVYLWDRTSGDVLLEYSREIGEFRGAFFGAFSADGARFLAATSEEATLSHAGATADFDLRAIAWRLADRPAKSFTIRALGATSEGWRVALEAWGEQFVILDPVSQQLVWREKLVDDFATDAAFSADARRVVIVSGKSKRVRVIDLPSQKVLLEVNMPESGEIVGVAMAPSGDRVAIARGDGVTCLTVASQPGPVSIRSPFGDTSSRLMGDRPLAFFPDGKRVVVGYDRGLRVHDSLTGQLLDDLPFSPRMAQVSVSPDGKTALVTGDDTVHLLELEPSTEAP
jgi:serine/threonine protein kinase